LIIRTGFYSATVNAPGSSAYPAARAAVSSHVEHQSKHSSEIT
jgi:hypothetical protein